MKGKRGTLSAGKEPRAALLVNFFASYHDYGY